ncbi:MAG TPA: L,D-transpeptidase [Gaiellaceae bacterium]|nr:L,D-transpeptidase [Gaiellaceae bacterium]
MRTTASRRRVAFFSLIPLALLAGSWSAAAPAPAATAAPVVKRTQELAVFVYGQTAMARPDNRSARRVWVERKRPITLGRTVLPVIGHRTDARGARWLRVRLPGRPNNSTGWIRKARTTRSQTPWHLVVDLSERRVTVYRSGRAVRSFAAVVGAWRTPTPRGKYFVEESVLLRSWDVGAPYALALSSRSYVLQRFAGGPGQIAIHGVRNVGGRMGTAASHGCVRLDTASVTWLGERIGPGVPVTVVA